MSRRYFRRTPGWMVCRKQDLFGCLQYCLYVFSVLYSYGINIELCVGFIGEDCLLKCNSNLAVTSVPWFSIILLFETKSFTCIIGFGFFFFEKCMIWGNRFLVNKRIVMVVVIRPPIFGIAGCRATLENCFHSVTKINK
jgi:hypothetical protein